MRWFYWWISWIGFGKGKNGLKWETEKRYKMDIIQCVVHEYRKPFHKMEKRERKREGKRRKKFQHTEMDNAEAFDYSVGIGNRFVCFLFYFIFLSSLNRFRFVYRVLCTLFTLLDNQRFYFALYTICFHCRIQCPDIHSLLDFVWNFKRSNLFASVDFSISIFFHGFGVFFVSICSRTTWDSNGICLMSDQTSRFSFLIRLDVKNSQNSFEKKNQWIFS